MDDSQDLLEQVKNEKDFFKKAKILLKLKKEKQVPVFKISQELNLKPSYVSHILRLNKLPELIMDGYYTEAISISHLFIISRLTKEEDMVGIYEQALANNLTALQTEELVRQKLYNIKGDGEHLTDSEQEEFIKQMNNQGVDAKIIQSRIKGKMILEIKGNLAKTTTKIKELMSLLKSKFSNEVHS